MGVGGGLDRRDVVLLGLAFLLSCAHAFHFDHYSDDAFISFRYAANWADGHGPVFNPGERVMGYSNFSWVALLAGLEKIGLAAPVASRGLGILLAWGTLTKLYLFLRRGSRWPGVLAVAFLVASGTFSLWMIAGLEGHLFAFELLSAVLASASLGESAGRGQILRTGLWLVLLVLTRPEGFGFALAVGASIWLQGPSRTSLRAAAMVTGIALLSYVLFVLWSWSYYGDPLPNTYYAKTHSLSTALLARALDLIGSFVRATWGAPILVLLLWIVSGGVRRRGAGWFAAIQVAAFLAFFLRVGGDVLEYFRLWLTILPLLALLLAESLDAFASRRGPSVAGAFAICLLMLPMSFTGEDHRILRRDQPLIRDYAVIGKALRGEDPSTLVAANNIGMLGYYSELPILDMLGLTDRNIARMPKKGVGIPGHESHNGAYVLSRKPDIIIPCMPVALNARVSGWAQLPFCYPSDADLAADPRTQREYRIDNLELADGRFAPILRRRVDR